LPLPAQRPCAALSACSQCSDPVPALLRAHARRRTHDESSASVAIRKAERESGVRVGYAASE
jgi:hypothetical protein